MDKEFATYEQALALKELGFDEPCLWFYANNGNDGFVNFLSNENGVVNKNNIVTAPLYQQAFRWFRKNHGLYSDIVPKKSYPDNYVTGLEWYVEICGGDGKEIGPDGTYSFKEAEQACLDKLIEISKNK